MNDPRRLALWIGFLVSAAVNVIGNSIGRSTGGAAQVVGLVAGVACVGFVAALIIHHYAGRRP
ncbi:hypothetical protein ACIBEJ_23485 [Nonomuraea sp. NPDC050790]|uniref:hypothetical protein n=1 Tax=Nonomuraea sp. NPDC050790 TaxID=3364371 RepID=UPI0037AAC13C